MNTSDATIHTDTFKTNQTNYIRNSTYFFLNPSFWNKAFMSITTQSRAENPCLQIKTSFLKNPNPELHSLCYVHNYIVKTHKCVSLEFTHKHIRINKSGARYT